MNKQARKSVVNEMQRPEQYELEHHGALSPVRSRENS